MTVLIGRFRLQNETLVNGIQDMNQKIINQGVLKKMVVKEYFPKYVGNPISVLYPRVTVLLLHMQLVCPTIQCINILIFWRLLM